MTRRTKDLFGTITTEGTLLPPDLLQRVAAEDRELGGLTPADYHLSGERLREAITRAWNRLLAAWRHFDTARASLAEGELGTSITRERWLLPLFQELGYGRLEGSGGFEIEGKRFAVSHLWRHVPIHLVGCRVDLDRHAAGVAGAARASPHGLMQELLNRRDDFLWGFVANGLRLRVLRDSRALTRQAYVEFDLESMLRGERYADFAVLWLIVHESRVEADKPSDCWLEKWTQAAAAQGTRALEQLRDGVTKAIESLGRGFLAHTKSDGNRALRARLESGELATQDYYRELLRLVYRMLFLFVAEDRRLLLDPSAADDAKERFRRWYSTARLRQRAERRRGGPHVDLWCGLRVVMDHLAEGRAELALPALGSFLWSREALPNLVGADVANRDLLDAVRALAFTSEGGGLRAVDWKNLGSEELGSVYESLLELHPRIENDAFSLATAGGNERKTSGSYYTPSGLVECLLDSALDPVLDEAAKKSAAEQAILALKVCDPACGSGHFLIAAAHRIARRLASVRTGDDEPSPEATRHALRDVIGRCLYGVDLNPMAVELCRVSLWMEALEPGRPLSFLDHRIQCGNSLLGTTPALLAKGIPDEAFEPIEGDEKEFARALKKQNRDERKKRAAVLPFAGTLAEPELPYGSLASSVREVGVADDDTLASVRRKEERWLRLTTSADFLKTRLLADAWCGAFVWRKNRHAKAPLTQAVFEQLRRDPAQASADIRLEVARLADQYRFFHWHVAFPDVFRVSAASDGPSESAALGWSGGFDVVLGNPPWERIKLQEKEFFAQRRPEIAKARNASERWTAIDELRQKDPLLVREFSDACRTAEGESHLVRDSGRYPLCGRGDVNTYSVFAETMCLIISTGGRVGCIVPSGIATDETTKLFFQDLVESRRLVSLFSFENEEHIFGGIHNAIKFCLLVLSGSRTGGRADMVFFARTPVDLSEHWRHFALSSDDFRLLNPNTMTCPTFRSEKDAEITKHIYRRVPVLVRNVDERNSGTNPWGIRFITMFHMANDSGQFLSAPGENRLPLYEGKLLHIYDHRYATYEGATQADLNSGRLPKTTVQQKLEPTFAVRPRYWIDSQAVEKCLTKVTRGDGPSWRWQHSWLIGWRRISRSVDERTVIACPLPRVAAGDNVFFMLPTLDDGRFAAALIANLSAFVLDYVARQKIGGTNITFNYMEQLPVLPPTLLVERCAWIRDDCETSILQFIVSRVLELAYTAWDLAFLARDFGWTGPPFRWDEERRFLIRCELDAAFFHLYLGTSDEWRSSAEALTRDVQTPRAAVAHILDTFPIVRRHDEGRHGTYRTKDVILEIYDDMCEAMKIGRSYVSRLNPLPADRRCAHSMPESGGTLSM